MYVYIYEYVYVEYYVYRYIYECDEKKLEREHDWILIPG